MYRMARRSVEHNKKYKVFVTSHCVRFSLSSIIMCSETDRQNTSPQEVTGPSVQEAINTSTSETTTTPIPATAALDQYLTQAHRLLAKVPLIGTQLKSIRGPIILPTLTTQSQTVIMTSRIYSAAGSLIKSTPHRSPSTASQSGKLISPAYHMAV